MYLIGMSSINSSAKIYNCHKHQHNWRENDFQSVMDSQIITH